MPPTALYGVPAAPAISSGGFGGSGSLDFNFQAPSFSGLSTSYGVPIPNIPAPILPTSYAPTSPSVVPHQAYGVPFLSSTSDNAHNAHHSTHTDSSIPPTALPLPQPKKPVKFRPPVPVGLISSIGAKWSDSWGGAQKQAHHHHEHHHGPPYIPPAVPDPDPGVSGNKGNAIVIPPPTAPPVQYGPPPSGGHHSDHQPAPSQFDTSVSVNAIEGTLNPPPPPPLNQDDSYKVQPSIPFQIPTPENQAGGDTFNQYSSTSNDFKIDIRSNAQSQLPSSSQSFNLGTGSSVHNTLSSAGTSQNVEIGSAQYQQTSSYVTPGSSFNQNFGNEVQTIPIKGSQGSYSLQIQAAGGNSDQQVPHGEVLSNGLLQDILAAIENPAESIKLNQYNNEQVSDPVANEIGMTVLKQLGPTLAQESISHQLPTQYGKDLVDASSNDLPQITQVNDSEVSQTGYNADSTAESSNIETETVPQEGKVSDYLQKNNVALYYNTQGDVQERSSNGQDLVLVKMLPNNSTSSTSQEQDATGKSQTLSSSSQTGTYPSQDSQS